MSCTIESGYSLPCRDIGGLKDLWITNWNSNETSNAITFTDGQITGLPFQIYHLFALMLESASYQETLEANTENGTAYWRQTLSIVFYKINQDLLNLMQTLVTGRFRIIFQDQNGEYRLFGLENAVRVIESVIQTGKLMSELNGATVTFSTLSEKPAPSIEKTVAENALYPDLLEFQIVLDPVNEFSLGGGTTPDVDYEIQIEETTDFVSAYGTAGIPFPLGNITVNQTKTNLENDVAALASNSSLDETGPLFFTATISADPTDLTFVWTDEAPGSFPYTFEDGVGNLGICAPVGVLHPDGVVLANLLADIQIQSSPGLSTLPIEFVRSHPPIVPPTGYEGSLNFLTPSMSWDADFTFIEDPLNPDRITADLAPGSYKVNVKTEYDGNKKYPASTREIVFRVF